MSAPIWMASPPEVHSALLSSGPGPGPLLESAAAWTSLSTAYSQAAGELTALLDAVRAGAWEGATADAYIAAHAPYLAWLEQASADAAAAAAQHEAAAAAYSTALAAMPTLAELAANHATHAVLVATNFFGINTIPIALNEADYVRMWMQAATVMGTYDAVSAAALTAVPPTPPAPEIVKSNALTTLADQGSPGGSQNIFQWLDGLVQQFLPPELRDLIGSPFYVFENPENFASWFNYNLVPQPGVTLADAISEFLAGPGYYIEFYPTIVQAANGNLAVLVFASLVYFSEIGFEMFSETLRVGVYLVATTPFVPLATAAALPLAATPAGAAGGFAGLAGLAGLAAHPTAVPIAPPAVIGPVVIAPVGPATAPASSPAPGPAPSSTAASAPPPAPDAPPPAQPTPAGPQLLSYLVGNLGMGSPTDMSTSAKKKSSTPDAAKTPAAASATGEEGPARRRRRPMLRQIGRGYEYMDLEPEVEATAVAASDHGGGPLGFTGTTRKPTASAAGLTTLRGDAFDGGPRMPLIPGSWGQGKDD
ncbi:PPE family protein [Mycobacterium xenopi]|uniref:PPE family protein n=1 Tax=Mycobacterium xenopi TaxID=1789 RepID=UPI0022EB72DA|nr:PPE family protein [Mycobacterium xenopi]MDA3638588.1 PPE family protein [Mycobacterium xenopi]MDA3656709.1 PPE family protein [Mycobacterium xenopi]MDA3664446.1 PPE family protein [Mycobacterium xenopi]